MSTYSTKTPLCTGCPFFFFPTRFRPPSTQDSSQRFRRVDPKAGGAESYRNSAAREPSRQGVAPWSSSRRVGLQHGRPALAEQASPADAEEPGGERDRVRCGARRLQVRTRGRAPQTATSWLFLHPLATLKWCMLPAIRPTLLLHSIYDRKRK